MHYKTIQYSAIQHSTAQHSTVLFGFSEFCSNQSFKKNNKTFSSNWISPFVNIDPDIQTLKASSRVFSVTLVMRLQLLPCLLVIPLKVLSVTGLQLFMNHSQSPLKMWVMLNIALCRTPSANNNIALPFLPCFLSLQFQFYYCECLACSWFWLVEWW